MGNRLQAALVVGLAGCVSAQADVLWDQSAISLGAPISYANWTKTSGFGQREAYGMSDVTVPASGWTIQSISVYMGTLAFNAPTTATLNIFPKTGSLPTAANNPRPTASGGSGLTVPVSVLGFEINGNSGQFANEVTASGLNIVLAPGDYWIGLTPRYVGSTSDNQWPALTTYGNNQAVRFATPLDAAWSDNAVLGGLQSGDGAIKIQGVPTPGALSILGLGGLVAGRRRR
jgi:MYXO-CTERM domain-containing protein